MNTFEIYGVGVVTSFLLGVIFVKSYKWINKYAYCDSYFLSTDTTYLGLMFIALFSWVWFVGIAFDWVVVGLCGANYAYNQSTFIDSVTTKIKSMNRKINKFN